MVGINSAFTLPGLGSKFRVILHLPFWQRRFWALANITVMFRNNWNWQSSAKTQILAKRRVFLDNHKYEKSWSGNWYVGPVVSYSPTRTHAISIRFEYYVELHLGCNTFSPLSFFIIRFFLLELEVEFSYIKGTLIHNSNVKVNTNQSIFLSRS
jgi:hypothetical protein